MTPEITDLLQNIRGFNLGELLRRLEKLQKKSPEKFAVVQALYANPTNKKKP